MDAVHELDVRTVALMKCTQSGGSEALNNIIGYFIEHDPCPMLLVQPTAHVAQEYSKERLGDMLRSTPALAAVVQSKRATRDDARGESTLELKMFPGGYLALGGANTPNTFARRAVRISIGDDVDRFPPVVGDEGDPADLLVNRTTSFHNRLSIFVSTPTLKGGRIDTLYERSDRRRFFVRCANCNRSDYITWNDPSHFRVVFDDGDPDTARIECPDEEHGGCGARHDEPARIRMVSGGAWQPTATSQEPGLVGFHVPAMLSPWVSLSELVEKFLSARARGRESFRVFVNTSLGEGWEERGARMDPHPMYARREDYGDGVEAPADVCCLTAGVDVQSDRFDLLVLGWAPAQERWVVDWRTVPGDPRRPETRAQLLEALSRKYTHELGVSLPILAACIDSGFATDEIYDFVLAHQHRRFYATKGYGGKSGEPIVGKPQERRYGRAPRPVRLYPLNVDDAKGEILSSLALTVPGPGMVHFPSGLDSVDEEFFAQICAEHRETRYNKGGVATHYVWVQDRERNEALDCAVLALAAFRLLNPNLREMAERIRQAAGTGSAPPVPTSGPAGSAPAQPRRRVARSNYLQS